MTISKIALIGFMGSGKSSVSLLLAKRLNLSHVEMDELIVKRGHDTLSVHGIVSGEEAALLYTLRQVRAAGTRCALLIVPRHAERRAEIEQLLAGSGLRYHFRTRGAATGEVEVSVADTTG